MSLYQYISDNYGTPKVICCDNCKATDELIYDQSADIHVCVYCAKNSTIDAELDVIWCSPRKEVKREG